MHFKWKEKQGIEVYTIYKYYTLYYNKTTLHEICLNFILTYQLTDVSTKVPKAA